MKEYSYFIPGYTGFCPELREHFGQTYGHATRHIIHKNPNLKERLAPVHYRHRRYERVKGPLRKYLDQEQNAYDYPKSKHRTDISDASKAKYRTEPVGDTGKGIYHPDYAEADLYREKCYGDYDSADPCRIKFTSMYADGDKIRKTKLEGICPKHVFIKGFAECAPPKMWTPKNKQNLQQEHYSSIAFPCTYVRDYPEHHFSTKKPLVPIPHVHLKECYLEDCGRKKDAKFDTDFKVRRTQPAKQHRTGGVKSKHTFHVPECVAPKRWTPKNKQNLEQEHYPCAAIPCAHVREYPEHHFSSKQPLVPKPHVHLKEYHPEDCGHEKDAKFGSDRKWRRIQRVRPHRQGGVIPKYTGHVPGMQFTFGESYGPVSDRLLQKHHGRMKELKIKS